MLFAHLCKHYNKNLNKLFQNYQKFLFSLYLLCPMGKLRKFFLLQKYASFAFGNIVALTVNSVNIRATCASGCSPVRLIPAVEVTTGAHYRMSMDILHPHSLTKLAGTPNELQK
jgi:hypothetical protein